MERTKGKTALEQTSLGREFQQRKRSRSWVVDPSRGWLSEIPSTALPTARISRLGPLLLPLPGAAGLRGWCQKPVHGVGGCRWLPEQDLAPQGYAEPVIQS